MTRYLVATASAATTEAACDYLERKLADDDEVYVLAVAEAADPAADRDDALRRAQERLAETGTVRTIRREGDPGREIVGFARDRGVDEVVLAATRGGDGIGSTTRLVMERVDVPVFVLSP